MIIRIVKMTFVPGKEEEFRAIFNEYRERIGASSGCTHLELWNDLSNPNVFFTYSHWEDESSLTTYRNSELFNQVWPRTKALFASPAEAWSVNREYSAN